MAEPEEYWEWKAVDKEFLGFSDRLGKHEAIGKWQRERGPGEGGGLYNQFSDVVIFYTKTETIQRFILLHLFSFEKRPTWSILSRWGSSL